MLRAFVLIQLVICFQAASISSFNLRGINILESVKGLFNNPLFNLLGSVTQANEDLKAELNSANETRTQLETTRNNLIAQLAEATQQCDDNNLSSSDTLLFGYNLDDIDACHNASLIMQQAYLTSLDATNFVLNTTNSFYLATQEFETCSGNSTKQLATCVPAYAGQMKTILVQTRPTAVNYELELTDYKNQFVSEIKICFGLEDQTNAELQAKLNAAQEC